MIKSIIQHNTRSVPKITGLLPSACTWDSGVTQGTSANSRLHPNAGRSYFNLQRKTKRAGLRPGHIIICLGGVPEDKRTPNRLRHKKGNHPQPAEAVGALDLQVGEDCLQQLRAQELECVIGELEARGPDEGPPGVGVVGVLCVCVWVHENGRVALRRCTPPSEVDWVHELGRVALEVSVGQVLGQAVNNHVLI